MPSEPSAAGRPRDPDLSGRLMTAALEEYTRTGWASFSMQGVARRAGVGKSALYLRWPSKELLLVDSLESVTRPLVMDPNTGSLHGDLLEVASSLLQFYLGPVGWVTMRVAMDIAVEEPALHAADLDAYQTKVVGMHRAAISKIVTSAVERGELNTGADMGSMASCLFGGVVVHSMALSPSERERAHADPRAEMEPMVAFVVRGIRPEPSTDSGPTVRESGDADGLRLEELL